MPELTSQITGAEWEAHGPQTAAQRFFLSYKDTVDNKGWTSGTGAKYYARKTVFHNQNNAKYYGPQQMWDWIHQIFGSFERLRHDVLRLWEIKQDDGTSTLLTQMVRNVWVPGNTTETPTAAAPCFMVWTVGPADDPEGFEGLQYHEVWLYWDTMLLAPFMKKDAVAFSVKNVVTGE